MTGASTPRITRARARFSHRRTLPSHRLFLDRHPAGPEGPASQGRPPCGGPVANPSLMRRMTMRTDFDFAPLYRATVGFDRVLDMLDSMVGQPNHGGYPPYTMERAA